MVFKENNWFEPQTVSFIAEDDFISEGLRVGIINHTVQSGEILDGFLEAAGVTVEAEGGASTNEVQIVRVENATGGDFALELGDERTFDIAHDAPAATVEMELEKLEAIDGVAVTRMVLGRSIEYRVEFEGPGATDVELLVGDPTDLTSNVLVDADGDLDPFIDGSGATLDLKGRVVEITSGVAQGVSRVIVDNDATSLTLALPFGPDLVPVTGDEYVIRLDDSFVGQPDGLVTGTLFTDADTSFPETTADDDGLRGSTIEITSGPGVGQSRLIETSTTSTLTLFKPWDAGAQPDSTSTYRISRYAGLAIPTVPVEIVDDDAPGVLIEESDGNTRVIEGGASDSYTVVLTRSPSADEIVTVTPSPDGDVVLTLPDGAPALTFDVDNWDQPQTVVVEAADGSTVEGFRNAFITHSVATANGSPAFYAMVTSAARVVAEVADDNAPGVVITETNGSTNVIEFANQTLLTGEAEIDASSVLVGTFPDRDLTGATIEVFDGAGGKQVRTIVANSASVIVVDAPWGTLPAATDAYKITETPVISDDFDAAFNTTKSVFRGYAVKIVTKTVRTIFGSFGIPVLTIVPQFDTSTNGYFRASVGGSPLDGDALAGKQIEVLDGAGGSQVRTIRGNSSEFSGTILLDQPWTTAPSAGDAFEIVLDGIVTEGQAGTSEGPYVAIAEDLGDRDLAGKKLEITSGAGAGQSRRIVDNTASILLLDSDWEDRPDATSLYAITDDVPVSDTYSVVLTRQPSVDVKVVVSAEATRTSRGEVVTFEEQVAVNGASTTTLIFTPDNWDTPQTVAVTAIDDSKVDGGDSKVFAQQLDQTTNIKGPLLIEGGFVDEDVSDLTGFDPVRLPGETNVTGTLPDSGTPTSSTIQVRARDIANFAPDLTNFTLRVLDSATGVEQRRTIISHDPIPLGDLDALVTLTIDEDWDVTPAAGDSYVVNRFNANFFVIEEDQVDALFVDNTDSVANNVGVLGDLMLDGKLQVNLSGLGMGPDTTIGDLDLPGGITSNGLEEIFVDLALGSDHLTIDTTFPGVARIAAGGGTDTIDVRSIAGHTFVDTGPEADMVKIGKDGLVQSLQGLLTLSGDVAQASVSTVAHGSPADGAVPAVDESQRVEIDATGGSFRLELLRERLELVATGGAEVSIDFDAGDSAGELGFVAGASGVGALTAESVPGGRGLEGVILSQDATLTLTVGVMSREVKLRRSNTDGASDEPGTGGGEKNSGIEDLAQDFDFALQEAGLGDLVTVQVKREQAVTADIPFGSEADVVTGALDAALLGSFTTTPTGNVQVQRDGSDYVVTFTGGAGQPNELAGLDLPLLIAHDLGLTNGADVRDVLTVDDSANMEDVVALLTSSTLTGLGFPVANAIQTLVLEAEGGSFTLGFGVAPATAPLRFDASAAEVEAALEGLATIGEGNVAVARNDDVYVIRFQGELTGTPVDLIAADDGMLIDGDGVSGAEGGEVAATVTSRTDNDELRRLDDVQTVTVDATGGSYALTVSFMVPDASTTETDDFVVIERTTDPIAYDASAATVRRALQVAVADSVVEEFKNDVWVSRFGNAYVIGFQGKLRNIPIDGVAGQGVGFLVADTTDLVGGGVEIATRMDGINYYGFEEIQVDFGGGDDVVNVQGASSGSGGFSEPGGIAVTDLNLRNGNEQIYVSSNADLDFASREGFDFLSGDLDDLNGALNIAAGAGRHSLMISDEGSEVGDSAGSGADVDGSDVVITDTPGSVPDGPMARGLSSDSEIWITGLGGLRDALPEGGISYGADGNFFDGITYWMGSGSDTIEIDGTHRRDGERTTTVLNAGLGDDDVTVSLDAETDGFFVVNAEGGSDPFGASAAAPLAPLSALGGTSDDDVIDASASTLPLILFGGPGDDEITGGSSADLIFGDFGRVHFFDEATGDLVSVLGFGGRGDTISSAIVSAKLAFTPDTLTTGGTQDPLLRNLGGADILRGGPDQDVLIGGADDDRIDGNGEEDLIFGDNVHLDRQGERFQDFRSPRFRTLLAPPDPAGDPREFVSIYDADGEVQVDGALRTDPAASPVWGDWEITLLDHSKALQDAGWATTWCRATAPWRARSGSSWRPQPVESLTCSRARRAGPSSSTGRPSTSWTRTRTRSRFRITAWSMARRWCTALMGVRSSG
jgi:hypothetical protein